MIRKKLALFLVALVLGGIAQAGAGPSLRTGSPVGPSDGNHRFDSSIRFANSSLRIAKSSSGNRSFLADAQQGFNDALAIFKQQNQTLIQSPTSTKVPYDGWLTAFQNAPEELRKYEALYIAEKQKFMEQDEKYRENWRNSPSVEVWQTIAKDFDFTIRLTGGNIFIEYGWDTDEDARYREEVLVESSSCRTTFTPEQAQRVASNYKIHLMPRDEDMLKITWELFTAMRQESELRASIYSFKVRAVLDNPQTLYAAIQDNPQASYQIIPRIIAYCATSNKAGKDGHQNAQSALNQLIRLFDGKRGLNITPRFSQRVSSLISFAQGQGDDKKFALMPWLLDVLDLYEKPNLVYYKPTLSGTYQDYHLAFSEIDRDMVNPRVNTRPVSPKRNTNYRSDRDKLLGSAQEIGALLKQHVEMAGLNYMAKYTIEKLANESLPYNVLLLQDIQQTFFGMQDWLDLAVRGRSTMIFEYNGGEVTLDNFKEVFIKPVINKLTKNILELQNNGQ
jgi:hypothetical protein